MKRTNQISYGDLFSSSNLSQSSFENRSKKNPSYPYADGFSQGNSQTLFTQNESFDSQNNQTLLGQAYDKSSKRSSSEIPNNCYPKQLFDSKFVQQPSKIMAATNLGLCWAKAQEIEERESMESVLSCMKNYSSEIKEIGHCYQEKLDQSTLLSNNLLSKLTENFKEQLAGHYLEVSEMFKSNMVSSSDDAELKSTFLTEVKELKTVLENQNKNLDVLLKTVGDMQEREHQATDRLGKELNEHLSVYARELTDLLRSFKNKINEDFSKKLDSHVMGLFNKWSKVTEKKQVYDKCIQVDIHRSSSSPSIVHDAVQKQMPNVEGLGSLRVPSLLQNINNSNGEYGKRLSRDFRNNVNDMESLSYSFIDLSLPKPISLTMSGSSCAFDSAIESQMSSPLDLSMKLAEVSTGSKGRLELQSPEVLHVSPSRNADALSSLVNDVPSMSQVDKVPDNGSLKTCTYQETQKTFTYWRNNSLPVYCDGRDWVSLPQIDYFNRRCSPAHATNLSFHCPQSTPLSHEKENDRDFEKHVGNISSINSCNSLDMYLKRQSMVQQENYSATLMEKSTPAARGRKQRRRVSMRNKKRKNSCCISDPDYQNDESFEHMEDSDKENIDPEAPKYGMHTRSKKKDEAKMPATEEEFSCTSNSTKSSSEMSVSQLFTVLDIY